jgi:MinD superfamily P-loop ATPase
MGLQEIKAQVATLGQMLRINQVARVDLLKIDVEGAELDVLLGLDPETWPRVHQVVMETHNRQGLCHRIARLLAAHGLNRIAIAQQRAIDNGLDSVILTARRGCG